MKKIIVIAEVEDDFNPDKKFNSTNDGYALYVKDYEIFTPPSDEEIDGKAMKLFCRPNTSSINDIRDMAKYILSLLT